MGDKSDKITARGPTVRRVPEGDNRTRLTCPDCGFIQYENPLIVAGAVVVEDGKVLLCRRSIEPRRGFWTIPAGYLELNETVEDGARREAREEACADIAIDGLLAVYTIPRISQVQLIYAAHLASPGIAAGEESLEVRFFDWDEIQTVEIAFPSVHWALAHRRSMTGPVPTAPFGNPDGETGDY
ncbi:NUDIX domain-containing protein [Pacificispira sp.]|uniref:NUDIX hydrolase n=1 Tax=Pacificispira sp. TaxID=2888761 RepID=UPI003B52CE8B